jgi:phosphatidylethanolamine/phosphatidyl-N-methylethanolamine N-methyltransferase
MDGDEDIKSKNDLEKFYQSENYSKVLETGIVGMVYRLTHKTIEKKIPIKSYFPNVLEVGAGTGQHFKFVCHQFDNYIQSDWRPENLPKHNSDNRITNLSYSVDASKLPFEPNAFDRLISTCVLAHLDSGYEALAEWRRVVKDNGMISIYVPSEPSSALRFIRRFTTARNAKKIGIDDPISKHYFEHRNHKFTMEAWINSTFKDDSVYRKSYPSKYLPFNLQLWEVYTITICKS